MSIDITVIDELAEVKSALRITHADDDNLLGRLLQSATRECLRFLNSDELPVDQSSSNEIDIMPDVFQGIVLMVQADYEGDPTKRDTYRMAAESLWMPYRVEVGV